MHRGTLFLAILPIFLAASALAEIKYYKHDQFSENIAVAASELAGLPLAAQPGFVKGEAFGQIYHPGENDYPIYVQSLELILAAPPNAPDLGAPAEIEFWLDGSTAATPAKAEPDWVVSTWDFLNPNTGSFGIPLQGNLGLVYQFDWSDPAGHPPVVNSGNIRVVVRFTDPAKEMQAEWGVISCSQMPEFGLCGCQNVGLLLDMTTTSNANLISHVTPLGQCSGGTAWDFFESIGVTGDVIMRLRVDAQGSGCVANCTGKECGSDGCEGICGTCPGGKVCKTGTCVDSTCTANCTGKECGSDGCDGSCGDCPVGKHCNGGTCTDEVCVPDCTGKECGNDGCDGSCGDCPAGSFCDAGVCRVVSTGEVLLTAISPVTGWNDEQTDVSIIGKGFVTGATAKLGGTSLVAIQVLGDGVISATVPKGMEPGNYVLVVLNPDGKSGFLDHAFEVKARPTPTVCGDMKCEPGENCQVCPVDCGQCPVTDPGVMPDTAEPDPVPMPGGGCNTGAGPGLVPVWLLLALAAVFFGRRRCRT